MCGGGIEKKVLLDGRGAFFSSLSRGSRNTILKY